MKLNISKIIALISALPALCSAVEQLVTQFEKPGYTGEQKKNTVLAVLKIGIQTGETLIGIDIPADAIVNIAGELIDLVVQVKNAIGEFKHATAPATTSTAAV